MTTYNTITQKVHTAVQTPWLCILLIVVATVAAFFPTFSNELLYGWDDQWQVTNHYTSGGFTWQNLLAVFTEPYYGQYSPINQCLYIFLYIIGRYHPIFYHVASLLLHVANACMVFVLVRKFYSYKCTENLNQPTLAALFATLLFALHPLQVESVAWVSASKIVLFAFFYLSATWVYLKFLDERKWFYYLLSLCLFLLSYGSKEQAVTFPMWLLLLHWLRGDSFLKPLVWLYSLPFFVLAALLGAWFMFGFSSTGRDFNHFVAVFNLWERIEIASFSIFVYLRRCLFPFDLSYLYPIPDKLPTWFFIYPLCTLVVLFTLLYKAHKVVCFALLFLVLHLSLTLHVLPMDRISLMADRYMYLPLVGVGYASGYYVLYFAKALPRLRPYLYTLCCLALLGWSISTYKQTELWHDAVRLKTIKQNVATLCNLSVIKNLI